MVREACDEDDPASMEALQEYEETVAEAQAEAAESGGTAAAGDWSKLAKACIDRHREKLREAVQVFHFKNT